MKRIPRSQAAFFLRKLATATSAGVPLVRAIHHIGKTESQPLRGELAQCEALLLEGKALADSFERIPGFLPEYALAAIRMGESTGTLDRILDHVAQSMERSAKLQTRLRAALRYPAFIFTVMVLMLTGILWKIVPIFEEMYQGFGNQLPGPTALLISLSRIFQEQFLWWVALAAAMLWFLPRLGAMATVKAAQESMALRLPVVSRLMRSNAWATLCRHLAILSRSGTPILRALDLTADAVGIREIRSALHTVRDDVKRGEALSIALSRQPALGPLIPQLVATGEEAGEFHTLLEKGTEFYEERVRDDVDGLGQFVEPLLVVLIGMLLGLVVLVLYLPIFNLGSLIHSG